jgi:hypothetical protein
MNQHAITEEMVLYVGAVSRLYNEDLTQLEGELSWVPQLAAGRIMARKELGCTKKASYLVWNYTETVMNPLPEKD